MERDIDELLENWFQTKKNIAVLEKKCERYKKLAEKLMDAKEEENLHSDKYILTRRNMTRENLSKKNVPADIWSKYCKKSQFSAYYFTKKKK